MNYKEVVDKIRQAVNAHSIIADFGYGQFSDIKVLDEQGDGADYPYAFLLPTGITRAEQAVTYSFNFIMMEMAKDADAILDVQSKCLQYIDDIIADLRADTTFRPQILLTQSTQVFRERFQDEVAGATATFNIVAPVAIDACFIPGGGTDQFVFAQNEGAAQVIDPDPNGRAITPVQPPTRDDLNRWNVNPNDPTYVPYSAFYVPGNHTYTITMTGTAEHTEPAGGEVVTQTPPTINPHRILNGTVQSLGTQTPISTNWPTTYTPGPFQWQAIYQFTLPNAGDIYSLNQVIKGDASLQESSVNLQQTTYTYEQL